MKIKPDVSERVAKLNQQRHASGDERLRQAKETIERRRNAERFSVFMRDFRFNKELVALGMLMRLEGRLESAAPMRPEDEVFNKAFREAAEMIPAMKGIIEDMQVEAMR